MPKLANLGITILAAADVRLANAPSSPRPELEAHKWPLEGDRENERCVQPETYLTRTQRTLLDAVQTNPGLTQKQLAGLLGLPHQTILYHGRKLAAEGKVSVARDGRYARYFAGQPSV